MRISLRKGGFSLYFYFLIGGVVEEVFVIRCTKRNVFEFVWRNVCVELFVVVVVVVILGDGGGYEIQSCAYILLFFNFNFYFLLLTFMPLNDILIQLYCSMFIFFPLSYSVFIQNFFFFFFLHWLGF